MNERTAPGSSEPRPIDPFTHLEAILDRDRETLIRLTESAEPLTIERLTEIDPVFSEAASRMAESALLWPDEESSVPALPDAISRSLGGDDADDRFVQPILQNSLDPMLHRDYFNNFFLHVTYEPQYPTEALRDATVVVNRDFATLTEMNYSSKPYLHRAYALVPDFMQALQRATAIEPGMDSWKQAMYLGHYDSDEYPQYATLLEATRYGYVLLSQLIRKDDTRIQTSLLGMGAGKEPMITDPQEELLT